MRGELDIDSYVSHNYKLADINKAFDVMHGGESLRSIINF